MLKSITSQGNTFKKTPLSPYIYTIYIQYVLENDAINIFLSIYLFVFIFTYKHKVNVTPIRQKEERNKRSQWKTPYYKPRSTKFMS